MRRFLFATVIIAGVNVLLIRLFALLGGMDFAEAAVFWLLGGLAAAEAAAYCWGREGQP